MREILVRNFDSTNPDPVLDRAGCRKRGIVDAIMPGGHSWGSAERLPKFVVIKCDLTDADLAAYEGLRKQWRDSFDYAVTATRPAQGEYDIRIFEVNAGASGQNHIAGAKASKIEGYLNRWGCENVVVGTNQVTFTFVLWNAVRSVEFWDISAVQLAAMSFDLVSYASGVGTITVTVPQATNPQIVARKVAERGGTITNSAHPSYTFTIERSAILNNFRQDIKRKAEAIYMYQRFRFNTSTMDAAVDAGGVLELSKAQLLSAIRDMQAE